MTTSRNTGALAVTTRTGTPGRVLEFLEQRPEWVLAGVGVIFALAHLARLRYVLLNGDGENYLSSAITFADGELARSHYSPGFAVLLTPIAWLTNGNFWPSYYLGSVLNIGVSLLGLYLVYRFLQRYLGSWTAVALVSIFALGESATNVLIGIEVEPLALLSVSATLVALQEERTWLAVLLTGVGAISRVALTPFFVVVWALQLRRHRAAALAAIAFVVLGIAAYLALQAQSNDQSYSSIAARAYGVKDGSTGLFSSTVDIVPDHLFRYLRLGIPAIAIPSAVLTRSIGRLAGLATTAVAAVGVWQVVRHRSRLGEPDGVLLPVIFGGLAYFGLLIFWPANDGAVVRFVVPMAAPVLLVIGVGVRTLAAYLPGRWPVVAPRVLLVCVLAACVAVTGAFVARRHRNTGESRAYLVANERARDQIPAGPVLAHFSTVTEVVTGHRGVGYRISDDPERILRQARRVRACAVVVDEIGVPEATSAALRIWADQGGATVIASSGRTFVVALHREDCSLPRET